MKAATRHASNACPETAIQIEIVKHRRMASGYAASANAPGLPSADDSIPPLASHCREECRRMISRVDAYRVKPEQPHWPLVFMTTLTQLSVFALIAIWVMEISERLAPVTTAAFVLLPLARWLWRVHPSPGTSHICLARSEDLEAVMAES